MKKSILNLGEKLNKTQQLQINGGHVAACDPGSTTWSSEFECNQNTFIRCSVGGFCIES